MSDKHRKLTQLHVKRFTNNADFICLYPLGSVRHGHLPLPDAPGPANQRTDFTWSLGWNLFLLVPRF